MIDLHPARPSRALQRALAWLVRRGTTAGRVAALSILLLGFHPLQADAQTGASARPPIATGRESPTTSSLAAGNKVALGGRFADRALLVINGQTLIVSVGESVEGVRLLGWRADKAEVVAFGERLLLSIGGAPVDLARSGRAPQTVAASPLVLQADEGGHFLANGTINGRNARFMIDTGATLVALSQVEADRLGITFREAPRGMANTASGEVPVHRVMLQTVRLGTLEVPMVEAVVMPAALPHVLLGNNFLERFSLLREGRTLTLQRRP